MPTLRRRPVTMTPIPEAVANGTLPPNAKVFYLKATGEIFLDFESFSNRIAFYLQKIFSDEATGKTNIDYYTALNAERRELENIIEKFPKVLKPRLLKSAQFQYISRLDTLVDVLFERYKNRFFAKEQCIVDFHGEKIGCRIAAVVPPELLVGRLVPDDSPMFPVKARADQGDRNAAEELMHYYAEHAHYMGTDLAVPMDETLQFDHPDAYRYSIAITPSEKYPAGSIHPFEVSCRQLIRDRATFSKTMLKRFLREFLTRHAGAGNAWLVKPRYAFQFGLPLEMPEELKNRQNETKAAPVSKRKKAKDEDGMLPSAKRPKTEAATGDLDLDMPMGKASKTKSKTIKYPIEDLLLDPMSIFDGRLLRRANVDTPHLPERPKMLRDFPMGIDKSTYDNYIQMWNFLNVFGWPLALSNFTLDQWEHALVHDQLEPRCDLIAEIHGCLLTIITAEGHRIPNTSPATASGLIPPFAPNEPGTEEAAVLRPEREALIKQCLEYSRKWDRSKRLTTANARLGWERHLIGCLVQRGAIETVPELPRILKHLMKGYRRPTLPGEADELNAEVPDNDAPLTPGADTSLQPPDSALTALTELSSDAKDEEESEPDTVDVGTGGPVVQYLTLPIADKLIILNFLVEMVINSRVIRQYIDACENALTELRKERLDVNRDRKTLLIEKSLLEQEAKEGGDASFASNTELPPVNGTNGHASTPPPSIPPSVPTITEAEEGSEIDELASDAETSTPSLAPAADAASVSSKAASRQSLLRERALQKQAETVPKSKDAMTKKLAKKQSTQLLQSAGHPESPDLQRIAQEMALVEERDLLVDREFRRHKDVLRLRPLGKDRFFNRYWYFDGIGTMELISAVDGSVVYGSGKVFVQGPCQEDYDLACSLASDAGEDGLRERRLFEEGDGNLLEVDEWAYIFQDSEVEKLNNWLNAKGHRENALRQSIKELRTYIREGSIKRQQDLGLLPVEEPVEEPGNKRRSTRAQPSFSSQPSESYLRWNNDFAAQVLAQNTR